MSLFLLFEQQQPILILLPFFLSLTLLLFFCAKTRPSKDLAAAPPAKKSSKLKKDEVKKATPKKQPTTSSNKKKVVAVVEKEEEGKKILAATSSDEKKKESNEQLKASKTGSSDDGKKGAIAFTAAAAVAKGSNETNVKPSEHIASELRKENNKQTGMKGSHEVEGKKAVGSHEHAAATVAHAGKKAGSQEVAAGGGSKDKVPNEYDLHRSQTPAIFPEDEDKDKKTNFTGSILEYNNIDTDEAGGLKKATTETSKDDEKWKKTLKPRVFEKNEKEKRIMAGEKRKSSEYPTMADVISDWTDQPKSSQPIPDSLLSSKKVEPI